MPYRLEFVLPTGVIGTADLADDRLVMDENQDWVSPAQAKFVCILSLSVDFDLSTFESGTQPLDIDNVLVCRVLTSEVVDSITEIYPGLEQIVDDSDGCQCVLPTCLGPHIYPVPVFIEEE